MATPYIHENIVNMFRVSMPAGYTSTSIINRLIEIGILDPGAAQNQKLINEIDQVISEYHTYQQIADLILKHYTRH